MCLHNLRILANRTLTSTMLDRRAVPISRFYFYSSPFVATVAIVLLILGEKHTLKQVKKQLNQYLLIFVLGFLIVIFVWNIYYLDDEMQNSAAAMVTYFITFSQFIFYALTTANHLSFNKYVALQLSSASRLFFYA